jgi:hypothetical protein
VALIALLCGSRPTDLTGVLTSSRAVSIAAEPVCRLNNCPFCCRHHFYDSISEPIITYQKSRSENCRAKSQATKGWFKPMVCMLKNTWSRFVESNAIAADVTPSYRIEGMLYNVPDDKFGVSYAETFAKICTGSGRARRTRVPTALGTLVACAIVISSR